MNSMNSIESASILKRIGVTPSNENISRIGTMVDCHMGITQDTIGDTAVWKLRSTYLSQPLSVIFEALDNASMNLLSSNGNPVLDTSLVSPFINEILMAYAEGLSLKEALLLMRFPLRLTLDVDSTNLKFVECNDSCYRWENEFRRMLSHSDRYVAYRFGIYGNLTGTGQYVSGWAPNNGFTYCGERTIDHNGLFHFKSMVRSEESPTIFWSTLPYICEVACEFDRNFEKNYSEEKVDFHAHFSSGSTLDCGKDISYKFFKLDEYPYYASYLQELACPRTDNITRTFNNVCDRTSKILYVPKNFSERRTIGELNSVRAFYAQGIRSILVESIPSSWNIDLVDQAASRHLADVGSRSKRVATIDSSSASDRVPNAAFKFLYPKTAKRIDPVLDKHFILSDDSTIQCHMLSCAGNPVTFPCESVFFYSIAEGVRRFFTHLTGGKFLKPTVYGDDVEVDDRLAEATIRVLSLWNVKVNLRKTYFGDVCYRESCGAEYFNGIECSTTYFPRGFSHALPKYVSLQHALYAFPTVRQYLTEKVLSMKPEMTSHVAGTPCTDLWAPVDLPYYTNLGDKYGITGDLSNYPIKQYYTWVPAKGRTKFDPSKSRSLYEFALKHRCIIDIVFVSDEDPIEITSSWVDACSTLPGTSNSWAPSPHETDGLVDSGSYRLLVD